MSGSVPRIRGIASMIDNDMLAIGFYTFVFHFSIHSAFFMLGTHGFCVTSMSSGDTIGFDVSAHWDCQTSMLMQHQDMAD